ncbi:MAG TPA: DUF695 domain-containing protein [Candidatus Saccharimonadales bacterium]|jgi:hypothetical protein
MFGKSKKFQPLNEYPENWVMIQDTNEGKPMFVRVQASLKDAVGHPEYPYQIGVAVPLHNQTSNGLPRENEFNDLNAIEDTLCDTLTDAVLVAIITTDGMREFVFYAKQWKPEEYEARVNEIETQQGTHQLQFVMQHDPEWSTFKALLP